MSVSVLRDDGTILAEETEPGRRVEHVRQDAVAPQVGQPGDRIFGFGFSRGSFTARSCRSGRWSASSAARAVVRGTALMSPIEPTPVIGRPTPKSGASSWWERARSAHPPRIA